MAYREVSMWEILNVLRRIGRGESKSAVARATGHERRTVRRYVAEAQELGWVPGLHEADEELALEVYRRVRPGAGEEVGPAELLLRPHRDEIAGWLKTEEAGDAGLRLTKVHELLRRRSVDVSYASLRRFAAKHCGFEGRRRLTVRLEEVPAGDVAQVDFGLLGLIEVEPGKRRRVHALVVTLVHSRHQYVHVTHHAGLPDLIEGLEDAWEFFGGVVARVILDNLKAAVVKADRYEPVFNRTFDEYADYRGFVIDAAVVRSPTHKPHVERTVPYVRDAFFRGEDWMNLEHVQREAKRWVRESAGMRSARHDSTPTARGLRVEREGQAAALASATLRPADVAYEREDPSRPHRHLRQSVLHGPDAVRPSEEERRNPRRQQAGADLRRRRVRQGASTAASWRPVHRSQRLPRAQGRLHHA